MRMINSFTCKLYTKLLNEHQSELFQCSGQRLHWDGLNNQVPGKLGLLQTNP